MTATIIDGPYVRTNGKQNFAYIMVRSDKSKEQCSKEGRQYEWEINEYSLFHYFESYQDFLKLTTQEYDSLLVKLAKMLR